MARVFSGFDVSFTRPYENTQEYQEFKRMYEKYASRNGTRSQQFKHFSDAFNRVRTEYVQVTDDSKLLAAAIEGIKELRGRPGMLAPATVTEAALDSMIATLDPHSSYLNPEEYKELHHGRPVSGKCWTTPTVANGCLYIRSAKGKLTCFDLNP